MATPKQAGRLSVHVVCVVGGRHFTKDLLVPNGQTAGWCVNASGLYALEPALRDAKIGIWGKLVVADVTVADGDRIEVYVACTPEAAAKARMLKANSIAARKDLSDKQE